MSTDNYRRLTFSILDRERGLADLPQATEEEYPLPAWYRAVRETPLVELSVEDIAKACRQNIHLEHVVPIALRILQSEPLAGGLYDGELLASLKCVPLNHWLVHTADGAILKSTCCKARLLAELPDDLRQDVDELFTQLSEIHN